MRNLWDTLQSSTSLPNLIQFPHPSLSLSPSLPPLKLPLSAFYPRHSLGGLFSSRWRFSHLFSFYLLLQLQGWKSPLKDLIEVQRSSLHRSFSSKLPSGRARVDIETHAFFWFSAPLPTSPLLHLHPFGTISWFFFFFFYCSTMIFLIFFVMTKLSSPRSALAMDLVNLFF